MRAWYPPPPRPLGLPCPYLTSLLHRAVPPYERRHTGRQGRTPSGNRGHAHERDDSKTTEGRRCAWQGRTGRWGGQGGAGGSQGLGWAGQGPGRAGQGWAGPGRGPGRAGQVWDGMGTAARQGICASDRAGRKKTTTHEVPLVLRQSLPYPLPEASPHTRPSTLLRCTQTAPHGGCSPPIIE